MIQRLFVAACVDSVFYDFFKICFEINFLHVFKSFYYIKVKSSFKK